MKKTVILVIFSCMAMLAKAQLTLDSLDYPVPEIETDSLVSLPGLNSLPKQGANMEWNYGSAFFYRGLSSIGFSAPANNKFTTATRSSIQSFLLGGNNTAETIVKNTLYFTDNVSGYAYIGYSIKRQSLISRGPGGLGDSLIFQVFDTSFAANPQYILKYPAAYGSSWSYAARLTYHLRFYTSPVGIYGYYPGLEIIYRTVTDSVVGWGNMVLPYVKDTSITVGYPVIMIKESWVDIDSFQVSLPSYSSENIQQLLQKNNLFQGQKNGTFTYTFYRAGYSAPLAKFWANDAEFHYLESAGFDPNNTMRTGIKNISMPVVADIYPNPVTSSGFTITFARQDNAPKNLTITNSLGQVVQRLPLAQNQTTATINVPPSLANGMYYYTITETEGGGMVSGKFVLVR